MVSRRTWGFMYDDDDDDDDKNTGPAQSKRTSPGSTPVLAVILLSGLRLIVQDGGGSFAGEKREGPSKGGIVSMLSNKNRIDDVGIWACV